MGVLDGKKRSEDQLYEEAARLEIEEEVTSREETIAQREAVIKQLKKQYGPNWMRDLGLNRLTDLGTLRSFLTAAKGSMKQAGVMTHNPALSPLPMKRTKL